jgi:hypothetical protein
MRATVVQKVYTLQALHTGSRKLDYHQQKREKSIIENIYKINYDEKRML